MNWNTTLLFSVQFCKNAFQQKAFYILWLLFVLLLVYAGYTGHQQMTVQNKMQQQYQQIVRKSWTDNPDKHPHRMAHFGSFALRLKHPLSLFDFGMENYAGNAVFLEAHKQNTVNYSEASFSTGLLRMGELSIAMLLQIILPLIIFFLGFNSIASDRENGTLKIISSQGAGIRSLLLGRSLGLWIVSSLFFIPAFLFSAVLLGRHSVDTISTQSASRFVITGLAYVIFFWIVAVGSIAISATSRTSKSALMKLLGLWLLLAIILPRVIPVASSSIFPSPSKLQFETAIEKDILKQGDSHNPDDPFYSKLKDSLLKKYNVDSTQKLPFNYGGVVGKAGEQLSSETYVKHQNNLFQLYRKQNGLSKIFAWANPFTMIKNNSMAFAGSDFEAYSSFQEQAEAYRYALAQRMNDLQIQYVSNDRPKEGTHVLHIDKEHWNEFEDFQYKFLPVHKVFQNEWPSVAAMLFWLILSFVGIGIIVKRFKIIA